MDFLVELVMELLGEVLGGAIESPRVPKIIRTVAVCLLCVPFSVIMLILMIGGIRDRNIGFAVWCALVAVMMLGALAVLLRRIWKR